MPSWWAFNWTQNRWLQSVYVTWQGQWTGRHLRESRAEFVLVPVCKAAFTFSVVVQCRLRRIPKQHSLEMFRSRSSGASVQSQSNNLPPFGQHCWWGISSTGALAYGYIGLNWCGSGLDFCSLRTHCCYASSADSLTSVADVYARNQWNFSSLQTILRQNWTFRLIFIVIGGFRFPVWKPLFASHQ